MVNVLLAEDGPIDARMYLASLQETGFMVFDTPSVHGISRLVQEQNIDIILSDSQLEDGNGYEMLKALKQMNLLEGKLIIGMSSNENVRIKWQGIAHSFISKPNYYREEYHNMGQKVIAVYTQYLSGELPEPVLPSERQRHWFKQPD